MMSINAKAPVKSPPKIGSEKSQAAQQQQLQHHPPPAQQQKHSVVPFYISPHSLCNNKRLKRIRLKWAAAAKDPQHPYNLKICRKTEKRRRKRQREYSQLKADITIDLLSDDDSDEKEHQQQKQKTQWQHMQYLQQFQQFANKASSNLTAKQQQQILEKHIQQVMLYSANNKIVPLELSKVPNITLIPVVQQSTLQLSAVNGNSKRKALAPKRHSAPNVVSPENIVILTDEDDDDKGTGKGKDFKEQNKKKNINQKRLNGLRLPPAHNTHHSSLPDIEISPSTRSTSLPTLIPIQSLNASHSRMAQVDDEVTVSLVPKTSQAGHCGPRSKEKDQGESSTTCELPPMPPDETTVHTVIANRTYELSLTKLREGLGLDGQDQTSPSSKRSKGNRGTSPVSRGSPPPIALKLSSDLSISLISDDEEDNCDGGAITEPELSPAKLLHQQPQLAIQPIYTTNTDHQTVAVACSSNRRRKVLG